MRADVAGSWVLIVDGGYAGSVGRVYESATAGMLLVRVAVPDQNGYEYMDVSAECVRLLVLAEVPE